MGPNDWTRREVEAIVRDYLAMLSSELAGIPYNKAAHTRALLGSLNGRSKQSIEFKRANISAALLDANIRYISGYKPRSNYQSLISEVLAEQLPPESEIHQLAAADADRPMIVPEVDDILAILAKPPSMRSAANRISQAPAQRVHLFTNYIAREAGNRSLGAAGEQFVLNYERARLISQKKETLAARIEHTAKVRGDHEGFDILSFDTNGAEMLIEVKTTKYGELTPFFVSRNEVAVSEKQSDRYHVYRLYEFARGPRLYTLAGAITRTCELSAATFRAAPR